jgi:PAS domain S-box-containing protein
MGPQSEIGKPQSRVAKLALLILVYSGIVLLIVNLSAIVDLFLHSDISYFDEEHIIMGATTGLIAAILFGGLILYAGRLEKSVRNLKVAERAAVESEKKFRDLFESSQDVIFLSTPEGFFTEINPAGVRLFGYGSREEMLHIKTSDLYVSAEEREQQRLILEQRGYFRDHVINMKKKDGSEVIISVTADIIRDEDGKPVSYSGMMRDITSQRRMEQQLLQSQKMDSIGRLAGGIAHDFNNFLTTIQGYIDLVSMELADDSPARSNLNEARQAAEGAAELTSQLLLFSSHQPMDMQPVNLNHTASGLKHMIERLVGDQTSIVTSVADDLKLVKGDPGNLGQVIVHLALNANSYLPRGGDITITTCNGNVGEDYVATHPAARIGDFVTLSVSDSGAGFSDAELTHVFEPFYNMEGGGEREGLGLSMVYGIILRHDGWIDVASIEGMGTTFTIFLPAVAAMADLEEGVTTDVDDLKSAGERILLVEDDDAVRSITEKILCENGYEVISAHDAAEAFARFASERGDIQLVFSDVVLPGDDGIQLVENLRSHKPELAVLLASGYSDTAVDWQTVQSRGYRFMQKPYVMPELLKVIRELLTNTS